MFLVTIIISYSLRAARVIILCLVQLVRNREPSHPMMRMGRALPDEMVPAMDPFISFFSGFSWISWFDFFFFSWLHSRSFQAFACFTGRVMVNTVPTPGWLSTVIAP
jgi:hypothetical protein